MIKEKIYTKNSILTRISKAKARKLNKEITVYCIGSKANPFYGSLNSELGIFWNCIDKGEMFDAVVNTILYYTSRELGSYLKFYVKGEK